MIIDRLKRFFFGGVSNDPRVIDHVLPTKAEKDWREAKLVEAVDKYAKPFAADVKVERVTPPSYVLQHINEQTEDEAGGGRNEYHNDWKEAKMKSIEVQGIHLAHIGGRCEVSAQTMDGKWRTVISLPESDFLPGERGAPVSHIVEPSGIESAPERGI